MVIILKTIILHSQQQRLVTLNGEDGKTIVEAFTFADDQVKAVRLIARYTVWSLLSSKHHYLMYINI